MITNAILHIYRHLKEDRFMGPDIEMAVQLIQEGQVCNGFTDWYVNYNLNVS